MSNKVICAVCLNQTSGFCSFKKSKVKLNKRRVCDKFRQDMGKVKIKKIVPTVKRPDWFWDREEKRRQRKMELAKPRELTERKEDTQRVGAVRDTKHPLTGDLSRFKTTASKEKE